MPDLHENLQNIKKKLASIYTFDFIQSLIFWANVTLLLLLIYRGQQHQSLVWTSAVFWSDTSRKIDVRHKLVVCLTTALLSVFLWRLSSQKTSHF